MSCFGICYKKKPRMSMTYSQTAFSNGIVENLDSSPVNNRRRNKKDKDNHRKNVTPSKLTNDTKSSKPLYELKDKFRCLFCGGEGCKHEDYRRNKKTVIIGLNCDRINDELFASQRPSTVLIERYDLIKKFKELNIGLVVNVQRQGEHPYCGPNKGLEEMSGFTYHPEAFTTEGIRVRLSGWKDMNVPNSIPFMLDIVKDMLKTTKEEGRKVLVHCHAGYGRTGIVLACYMIFTTTKSAEEIVRDIRKVRNECVQKSSQMEYCKTFKNYIDMAREIFTSGKKDIDFFIKHQVDLSIGDDYHKLQHVPKLVCVSLEHMLYLKEKLNIDALTIYQSINGSSEWKEENEREIVELKINLNKGKWECIKDIDDVNILSEICFDWLEDCVIFVINPERIEKMFEDDKLLAPRLKQHISDPKQFSIEHRKTIIKLLKETFRMIEYETIACIAHFASKIFPDDDKKLKEEFRLMLEKLCIYMMGYNIDYLYENPNAVLSQKGITNVERFIDIIIFFIVVMNHDLNDENSNSFFNVNNPNNSGVLLAENMSQYVARRQFEEMNSSIFNSLSFNNYSDFPNFLTKHLTTLNDKASPNIMKIKTQMKRYSFNSDVGTIRKKSTAGTSDIEKEYILFNMYKSLHKYFDKKNPNDKSPDNSSVNFTKVKNSFNATNQQNNNNNNNMEMLNDFYDTFQNFMMNYKNTNNPNIPIMNLNSNPNYNSPRDRMDSSLDSPEIHKENLRPKLVLKNETIQEERSNNLSEDLGLNKIISIKKLKSEKQEINDSNSNFANNLLYQEKNSTQSLHLKTANFNFKETLKEIQEDIIYPEKLNTKELGLQREPSLELKSREFLSEGNFGGPRLNLNNMIDISNIHNVSGKYAVKGKVPENEEDEKSIASSSQSSITPKQFEKKKEIKTSNIKNNNLKSGMIISSGTDEDKSLTYSYIKPKFKRKRSIHSQSIKHKNPLKFTPSEQIETRVKNKFQ